MGCNRTPTEKEAQAIHEAASRVVAEVGGGASTARAEQLVATYGEWRAKAILREEQQAQQFGWSSVSPSYSFEQPAWTSSNSWQQDSERYAAEQRAAEQRAAEQRAAEQRAAEQRAAEQRAAEQRAAEQRAAEQRATEQRAAEQRATEQRAAEQRAAEQRAAEQRAAEQRAAEQKQIVEEKRLADGRISIKSVVGPPPSEGGDPRQHFERQFFPGVEVGLDGWQRSHSQGAGTGRESALGIRYAPAEVNQELQNRGIENLIRETYRQASQLGYEVIQTTVTETHPGSLRLSSIEYRLEVVTNGKANIMFEAEITISNDKENPRIGVSVAPGGRW